MSKKVVPAVFYQKKENTLAAPSKRPERLELFENELADVVGGAPAVGRAISMSRTACDDPIRQVCRYDDVVICL